MTSRTGVHLKLFAPCVGVESDLTLAMNCNQGSSSRSFISRRSPGAVNVVARIGAAKGRAICIFGGNWSALAFAPREGQGNFHDCTGFADEYVCRVIAKRNHMAILTCESFAR